MSKKWVAETDGVGPWVTTEGDGKRPAYYLDKRWEAHADAEALAKLLNERDRYRAALEWIAEMGSQEAESAAADAAQEALREQ